MRDDVGEADFAKTGRTLKHTLSALSFPVKLEVASNSLSFWVLVANWLPNRPFIIVVHKLLFNVLFDS